MNSPWPDGCAHLESNSFKDLPLDARQIARIQSRNRLKKGWTLLIIEVLGNALPRAWCQARRHRGGNDTGWQIATYIDCHGSV